MTVPYSFGSATSAIPLSQLDSNFNTPITLGNTAIQLGNTVTTLNNMTLANVTISSGSVTLTSVSVTNANVTSTLTLSGLTASTALALDASKNVVSVTNTGTGNNVLGTSPTMSGVTLSDGTANGVAYLNGSKVVTTGSALTFDGTNLGLGTASPVSYANFSYMTVNGTNGAGFRLQNTAGTTLSEIYENSNGLGIFSISNLPIIFGVNNAEQMRLTSTGLGIGTSSPTVNLHVYNASSAEIRIASANIGLQLYSSEGAGTSVIGTYTNHALVFRTNATERARIDSSGNFGIGATSMSLWGTASNPAIYIKGTNSGYAGRSGALVLASYDGLTNVAVANDSGSGALQFYIGTSEKMRLDASGNLGIGTTSPATALSSGTGGLAVQGAGVQLSGNGYFNSYFGNATYGVGFGYDTGGAGIITARGGGAIAFWTFSGGNAERARIDSSGRVLVNNTAVISGRDERLQVTGLAGSYGAIATYMNASTSQDHINFINSNGSVGKIQTSGSATTYATSSDYRLKNTIAPMTGALAKVAALKPVTYKWNADDSDGEGFIAHELAEVVPHAVTGEKDAVDEEGNPVYQGIDTSFLVATLTAAIQELKAEFDAYKATHP